MSALLAPAKPHRIKATHHRRRRIASGRFVQRYYDPDIGRFISPDPVGPEEDFVNHFNRYNYAQNNPVANVDPDGRQTVGGRELNRLSRLSKKIERSPMPVVNAIVIHRTGGSTAEGAISTWESESNTDNIGAHFLVDKDGTTTQTASTSMTTNHVGRIRSKVGDKGPFNPKRTNAAEQKKSYPNRYPTNNDSIGIEVVGSFIAATGQYEAPTAKQMTALGDLIGTLQTQFGLTNDDVYRHGDISYKQPSEGAGLGYDP